MKLLNTLKKGKEQLGKEALDHIIGFVKSQQTDKEAFIDKSGKTDLYYTFFGWMLSYILGIRPDHQKTGAYLSEQHMESMDLIHYVAFIHCMILRKLWKTGKAGFILRKLLSLPVRQLQDIKEYPHNNMYSPYSRFIWLSLLEDTGHTIPDKNEILEDLSFYKTSGGGYANVRETDSATTNATVAALAVRGQLEGYEVNEDIQFLRELQNSSGGFSATGNAPVPDLLSTATSLFMLKCYNLQPTFSPNDFIEAHWLDSGGFAGTLLEEKSDVEYTFYGLLALGTMN